MKSVSSLAHALIERFKSERAAAGRAAVTTTGSGDRPSPPGSRKLMLRVFARALAKSQDLNALSPLERDTLLKKLARLWAGETGATMGDRLRLQAALRRRYAMRTGRPQKQTKSEHLEMRGSEGVVGSKSGLKGRYVGWTKQRKDQESSSDATSKTSNPPKTRTYVRPNVKADTSRAQLDIKVDDSRSGSGPGPKHLEPALADAKAAEMKLRKLLAAQHAGLVASLRVKARARVAERLAEEKQANVTANDPSGVSRGLESAGQPTAPPRSLVPKKRPNDTRVFLAALNAALQPSDSAKCSLEARICLRHQVEPSVMNCVRFLGAASALGVMLGASAVHVESIKSGSLFAWIRMKWREVDKPQVVAATRDALTVARRGGLGLLRQPAATADKTEAEARLTEAQADAVESSSAESKSTRRLRLEILEAEARKAKASAALTESEALVGVLRNVKEAGAILRDLEQAGQFAIGFKESQMFEFAGGSLRALPRAPDTTDLSPPHTGALPPGDVSPRLPPGENKRIV